MIALISSVWKYLLSRFIRSYGVANPLAHAERRVISSKLVFIAILNVNFNWRI
jgi:hypothetical protein